MYNVPTNLDTAAKVTEYKKRLQERGICKNSIKTYLANIRAYNKQNDIHLADSVYKVNTTDVVKTYLTTDEIKTLSLVPICSQMEQKVLDLFILSCKTGCRFSDIVNVDNYNVKDNILCYTSQKTGVTAHIPVSEHSIERLQRVDGVQVPSLMRFNQVIKELCRRAGITGLTKVYKAGKNVTEEKCNLISSHTGRISFATNLSNAGTPLQDIAKLMGHRNPQITLHYIVNQDVRLSKEALQCLE